MILGVTHWKLIVEYTSSFVNQDCSYWVATYAKKLIHFEVSDQIADRFLRSHLKWEAGKWTLFAWLVGDL